MDGVVPCWFQKYKALIALYFPLRQKKERKVCALNDANMCYVTIFT
jgi:hypothetical protein